MIFFKFLSYNKFSDIILWIQGYYISGILYFRDILLWIQGYYVMNSGILYYEFRDIILWIQGYYIMDSGISYYEFRDIIWKSFSKLLKENIFLILSIFFSSVSSSFCHKSGSFCVKSIVNKHILILKNFWEGLGTFQLFLAVSVTVSSTV